MQKSGFPKIRHYVGFSQIGSHMCYFNNVPLFGMTQAKISTTILTWYEALNIIRHDCDFKKISHSICPDYLLHTLTII